MIFFDDSPAKLMYPLRSSSSKAMRIAIIQSCYIPWKGFFDLIGRCDQYVIYDSAQFSKGRWHNRNRIKTANGPKWLTIPVATAGRLTQAIDEVQISETWADRHWQSIRLSYNRAPFFNDFEGLVKSWYERAEKAELLTEINTVFLVGIAQLLGLKTEIVSDRVYHPEGDRMERLLRIVRAAGADQYLSGPSAREYFDEAKFKEAGISTQWMSYESYPEYPQMHGEFDHQVSILDLIFNVGPATLSYTLNPKRELGETGATNRA